jgi:hypothetical protein
LCPPCARCSRTSSNVRQVVVRGGTSVLAPITPPLSRKGLDSRPPREEHELRAAEDPPEISGKGGVRVSGTRNENRLETTVELMGIEPTASSVRCLRSPWLSRKRLSTDR